MANVQHVTYAKPKIAGAVSVADAGTTLPIDALTDLNRNFKNLGYISEDGLTNSDTQETETIKAWGGDVVLTVSTGKEDTFSFTLIESLNVEVLKFVYGTENVSGTLETGITVKSGSQPAKDVIVVVDMVMQGDIAKRIVIPNCNISETGEIVYADGEPVGYEVTLNAKPDGESDNTHYEYIQKKGAVVSG